MASKGKRYLKKIIEKYYEGIIADDDLSEDVKKQQLQDILAEVTHNEGKSTTPSADQQQKHGVSRTSPVIAVSDVSRVKASNQSIF